MPKFATTLEPIAHVDAQDSQALWRDMRQALEALHGLGFAHMDVKPANICFNAASEAVLIDLGSICPFGDRSSSTPAYCPTDLDGRASPARDWWMLAMTLAEKCCGVGHSLAVARRGYTKAEVRAHLAAYLDPEIWQELQTRLTD